MKLIDITGQKFGRLTVLSKRPKTDRQGGSLWLCRCECGEECERVGSYLRLTKQTVSCGCFHRQWSATFGSNPEFVERRASTITTHGQKRRGFTGAEYKTWLGMKARCYTPSNKDYPKWGGRGIAVCERWKNDFSAFLADMGQKPTPAHTIDRRRSNEDYSPDNCRWATIQEQGGENRRGFQPVVVRGISFATTAAACRHFGMGVTTVSERLKSGISIDDAFTPGTLPPRRSRESYLRKDLR